MQRFNVSTQFDQYSGGAWVRYTDHVAELTAVKEDLEGERATSSKVFDELMALKSRHATNVRNYARLSEELNRVKADYIALAQNRETAQQHVESVEEMFVVKPLTAQTKEAMLKAALEEIASGKAQPWITAHGVLDQVYGVAPSGQTEVAEGSLAPYPHAWQCRVVEERDQLSKRLADLRALLKGDSVNAITLDEHNVLAAQSVHMHRYLDVLNKRIEGFK